MVLKTCHILLQAKGENLFPSFKCPKHCVLVIYIYFKESGESS